MWEAAQSKLGEEQANLNAHIWDLKRRSAELERRRKMAQRQSVNERKVQLYAECAVLARGVEATSRGLDKANATLRVAQDAEEQCNRALDAAVEALNNADMLRRRLPEKWCEMHTYGGTRFLAHEHPLQLPSARTVGGTHFRSIFNRGFDRSGDVIKCPDGVGDRWHGRKAGSGKDAKDAEWVAPFDAEVSAWLGEGGLNWLATTSKPGIKEVRDTHALKAGVDNRGKNATTPEQWPLHADSCRPNSHVAARAPWGDAHLVMLTALQDGTQLPIYPFNKDGEREVMELNAGDVFVFRGDLIHIGAEYLSLNIRIHCYIDSLYAPEEREPDKTYFIAPHSWPIVPQ